MSHFSNVEAILKSLDDIELGPIVDLLRYDIFNSIMFDDYSEDVEEFARSLLFVLVSMRGGMHKEAWKEWRDNLSARVVDEEIELICWKEEDEQE